MKKKTTPNKMRNDFQKRLLNFFPGRGKHGQELSNPPIARRVSLGVKLPIIVITLLVLAFVISTFLSVQTSRSALTDQLQETLLAQTTSQSELIRSHLVWTRSMAVDLAAMAGSVDQNESDLLKTIESTLANNEQIFGSTIAYEPYRFKPNLYYWSPYYSRTPEGELQFTQLGNPEYNYFKWEWYTLPKTQRIPVLSPPYFDEGGGDIWMVTWSVPFFDASGNVKGVATADIAFSQTQEIVRQIAVGERGYAFLIDKQGTLMGIGDHGGKYQIMVDSMLDAESQTQAASWADLIASMVKGDSGFANTTDPNGQSVFVAYQPIGLDTGWSLGLAFPQTELFQPATQLRNTLILFAVLIAMIFAVILYFFTQTITRPLQELTLYTARLSQEQLEKGQVALPIQIQTHDELEDLANSFNQMARILATAFENLEQKVANRTHSLELAAEVGRSVSQVRALDVMLKETAELIRSQFDLYYVQVYLTNPSQTALVLQSGTGTVGAELVGRGHYLPLDIGSINGRAAAEKHPVVISDTATSATFRPNPLLPDTRSEMAVPLMIGEKVVGVLDLQSNEAGSLSQEILPVFEALAGQLAISIQNASLLAETEQARAELESQARRLVRANWTDYLDAIHKPEHTGFVFEGNKVIPLVEAEGLQPPAEGNTISAPIAVTGEPLGSLVIEMGAENQSANNVELVNIVARQVAQQIENLRLLESSERYRLEAEQASRRLTREGWKSYTEKTSETLSFMYDLKEVRPTNGDGQDESVTNMPLKVRDEIVGKLSIQGIDANDKDSFELANAVAERLSAHIESLRQIDETKRGQVELDKRARQLAAVAEISTASSKELDIVKMLKSVVFLNQRKFGFYHAHIFTFNENTSELEIAACGWKEGDEREDLLHGVHPHVPLSQKPSLLARAARTRRPIVVNDVKNEPDWVPNPNLPDTASEMVVPLLIGDQLLGVLEVHSERTNSFSEEDANIQTTLASQVSTALQNARSFEQAQKQAERESALNVISQKIQSATTVEAVLQIAARELGHALGAPLTIAQLGVKNGND